MRARRASVAASTSLAATVSSIVRANGEVSTDAAGASWTVSGVLMNSFLMNKGWTCKTSDYIRRRSPSVWCNLSLTIPLELKLSLINKRSFNGMLSKT